MISAAGRPWSSTAAKASSVTPCSRAPGVPPDGVWGTVQQRCTDSTEEMSVPSLSNSSASNCGPSFPRSSFMSSRKAPRQG